MNTLDIVYKYSMEPAGGSVPESGLVEGLVYVRSVCEELGCFSEKSFIYRTQPLSIKTFINAQRYIDTFRCAYVLTYDELKRNYIGFFTWRADDIY
jgi:hypothetical protein